MLDDATMNLPAKLRSLREIVDEYDAKAKAIPDTIAAFKAATTAAEIGATIGGTYAKSIWCSRGTPDLSERTMRANLLESAWRHVYAGLNIEMVAPASDRDKFERAFQDPAPFTLDNIRATFGKYLLDPRAQILRGLAEVFGKLDMSFKSHDRMKIGVKGLPKRIILSGVDSYGSSWGSKQLRDVLNALRSLRGEPLHEGRGFYDFLREAVNGGATMDGVTLKRFGNGNGHLFFDADTLLMVNKALAEYFGDVLPDCPEARPERAKGTAVAKDLQFYRTPAEVADRLVESCYLQDGARILEPSCGDGAILDAVRRYATKNRRNVRAMGIEVDAGRAAQARAKGYAVQVANFLEVIPSPEFDVILMNPPFYGKHYQQHVEHARKFLKPDGRLFAILPVTAVTDHGFVKRERYGRDRWEDLPTGSFSESGTNINTGIAKFFAA